MTDSYSRGNEDERNEAGIDEHGQPELFRVILEHTSDFIRVLDIQGRSIYSSPSVVRLFGGEVPETFFGRVHPDDLASCHDWWKKVLAGTADRLRWRVHSVAGDWHWLDTSASLMEHDGAVHVVTVCRDITEEKRAYDGLRESERLLRQVLHALPEGVVVTNTAGDIILSNAAARDIWGGLIISGAERYLESKGRRPDTGRPVQPDEWPSARALHTGQTLINDIFEIEAFDGARRTLRNSAAPIRNDNGVITGAVVVNENVTDVLRMEAQLRQAQKMEAIGHLAAGVAHDFNNLLTIIAGYSDILLPALPPDDPSREMLAEIRHAGERAAALTRQLLTFTRQTVLEPKVLDLNEIVREHEKLLRRLIGEDIQLIVALEPGAASVMVDPTQISQVIMNLVVNARDALPTGGRVEINTSSRIVEKPDPEAVSDARTGHFVVLSVTDNGTGMTAEVRAHIFEPFFTTKEPGKGTGLGLATVYGIVKQSGGFIVVDSEPGRGTSFLIHLPSAEPDGDATGATTGQTAVARGIETILLVEDEDAVRTMIRMVLQRAGYHVLEASRGASALRIAGEHDGPIHLLITDVVMPEMGGRELVERLVPIRPDLKVLYLSGYTDDAVIRHGVLQTDVAFLQKPFTITALAAKVRQVLGAV
jgi:two-component system cell cycle sensor histidine kinase/response regulator CckA